MAGDAGERVVIGVERSPVGGRLDNMTTASLERVRTTYDDGTTRSQIVKTLRPASASPQWELIPEQFHDEVLRTLDWLDEPRLYGCGIAGDLPPGLRMPVLHRIDNSSERITLWLEDVADTTAWTVDRYERTAHALGRLAGRWTGDEARQRFGLAWRDIGSMFFGKTLHNDLPLQRDGDLWREPHVVDALAFVGGVDAYRDDIELVARRMPEMLSRLDTIDSCVCHGDASTTNFLEPGDGTIVAIDWSYGAIGAAGSDLAQLVASRFDAGEATGDEIESIATTCLRAFLDGARAEGRVLAAADVEHAWATHLAIRSVFSALVPDSPVDAATMRSRAALARFGLDLALRSSAGASGGRR